jgi:hypothetical protein
VRCPEGNIICLVKDGSGYRIETSLQLSEVRAKLLSGFRIPDTHYANGEVKEKVRVGYGDNTR